jgi:hypothetical protein
MKRYPMVVFLAAPLLAAMFSRGIVGEAGGSAFGGWFTFTGARYDSDRYWEYSYVVIAQVTEARRSPDLSVDDTVVVHPFGTLSGQFDVGKNAEVTVTGPQAAYGLRRSDMVLVSLSDPLVAFNRPGRRKIEPRPAVPYCVNDVDDEFPYMPQGGLGIEKISGFSDRKVQRTLSAIQNLRRKPVVAAGTGSGYWRNHSLVCAEVADVKLARANAERYFFRILGTVSGAYDPRKAPKLSVVLDSNARHSMLDENVLDLAPHDIVLLLLETEGFTGHWHIPAERAAFMPFAHDPIILASRSWGPQPNNAVGEAIGSTLGEIQKRRVREAIPRK